MKEARDCKSLGGIEQGGKSSRDGAAAMDLPRRGCRGCNGIGLRSAMEWHSSIDTNWVDKAAHKPQKPLCVLIRIDQNPFVRS